MTPITTSNTIFDWSSPGRFVVGIVVTYAQKYWSARGGLIFFRMFLLFVTIRKNGFRGWHANAIVVTHGASFAFFIFFVAAVDKVDRR